MTSQQLSWNHQWAIALIGVTSISLPSFVSAQIIPDATLGAEASVAIPATINGIPSERIDGGALRGKNLFHSFREFNIGEGRGAYFANPVGVDNILSRVTGTAPSNLLGTLGVLGNANLFLINPNGILLGPNARLDIRGSFTASTADRVQFSNGFEFSASNPLAPPLLTVSVPLGLQYGARQSGTIINQGNLTVGRDLILSSNSVNSTGQLNAPNGTVLVRSMTEDVQINQLTAYTATLSAAQNLILRESQLVTSGDLTLHADNTVIMRDSPAKPFIAQAGGMLTVTGDRAVDIFALNHPNSGLFAGGDLVLRSNTAIAGDARYSSNGDFRVERLDGTPGDLFSPYDPIIITRGRVTIGSYQGASLHVLAGGRIIAGNIEITGNDNSLGGVPAEAGFFTIHPTHSNIIIQDLATVGLSDGTTQIINGRDVPTLDIRAGVDQAVIASLTTAPLPPFFDAVDAPGPPFILINGINYNFAPTVLAANPVPLNADITIGNVFINAPNGNVLITNRDRPNLTLPGGNIQIIGRINTSNTTGGNVAIDSRAGLSIINNGINTSSTVGSAGNIRLLANNNIDINNSVLATQTFGAGQAGNVIVNANQLILQNGSQILANTGFNSTGNAGSITLNIRDSVDLAQSFLFANTNSSGNAGTVAVNARQLTIRDGSRVSIFSQGSGSGGSIAIAATEAVDIVGTSDSGSPSGLFLGATSTGNAGSLDINTQRLSIRDGGIIYATTTGSGQAGNLTIRATEQLQVIGSGANAPSALVSETNSLGNAGTFNISTGRLLIQDGGNLSAQTIGAGQAGRLTVTATQSTEVSGTSADGRFRSRLFFNSSTSGDAGTLSLSTPNLTVLNGGQVSAATAGAGLGGILSVNAPDFITVQGTAANGQASTIDFSSSGSGDARGISLNTTGRLTLQDGGQILVSGTGTGISGNINISADSISLVNQGKIRATTERSEGGNIVLRLSNPGLSIYMENNSEISAEAFGFANAGTLTIDAAGSIISRSLADNNDIVANAIFGRGGKINATASLILNFRQFQGKRTSESDFTSLSESPSSGESSGEININTRRSPNSQALPDNLLTNRLAVVCQPSTRPGERSEFVIRSSGGIPSRAEDAMSSEAIAVGLVSPVVSSGQVASGFMGNINPPPEIVEAQQLIRLPDGTIALVAPSPIALPMLGCQIP